MNEETKPVKKARKKAVKKPVVKKVAKLKDTVKRGDRFGAY